MSFFFNKGSYGGFGKKTYNLRDLVQNNWDIKAARLLANNQQQVIDYPENPNDLFKVIKIILTKTKDELKKIDLNDPVFITAAILYKYSVFEVKIPKDVACKLLIMAKEGYTKEYNDFAPEKKKAIECGFHEFSGNINQNNLLYDYREPSRLDSYITIANLTISLSENVFFEEGDEIYDAVVDLYTKKAIANRYINLLPKSMQENIRKSSMNIRIKLSVRNIEEGKISCQEVIGNFDDNSVIEIIYQLSAKKRDDLIKFCNRETVIKFVLDPRFNEKFEINEKIDDEVAKRLMKVNNEDIRSKFAELIGKISREDPIRALSLLSNFDQTEETSSTILEAIGSPFPPITKNFANFLKAVVDVFPSTEYNRSFNSLQEADNSWEVNEEEDGEKENEDIWCYPKNCGTCSKEGVAKQHWFSCYTCNMTNGSGMCLPCALKCHKGHVIGYCGVGNYTCTCMSSTGACKFRPNNTHMSLMKKIRHMIRVGGVELDEDMTEHLEELMAQGIDIDSELLDFDNDSLEEDNTEEEQSSNDDDDENHETIDFDTDLDGEVVKSDKEVETNDNNDEAFYSAKLSEIFEKVLESELVEDKVKIKLNKPISEYNFGEMSTIKKPSSFRFETDNNNNNNSNFAIFSSTMKHSMSLNRSLIPRMSSAPFKLYCKITDDLYLFGVQNNLQLYSFSQKKVLQSINEKSTITQIEKSGQTVAVACIESVDIILIEEDNKLESIGAVEAPFTDKSKTVLYISFLKGTEDFLLVTYQHSLKVFDVKTDRTAPLIYYSSSRNAISSACCVVINDVPNAFVYLSSGVFALCDLTKGVGMGPQIISKTFDPISSGLSRGGQYTISYNEENKLVFISSTNNTIFVIKESDIGNRDKNASAVSFRTSSNLVALRGNISQVSGGQKSIFIFTENNLSTPNIYVLELTDNVIETSQCIRSLNPNEIIYERNGNLYITKDLNDSSMFIQDFAGSQNNYRKDDVIRRNMEKPKSISISTADLDNDGSGKMIDVPATFWTNSKIINDAIVYTMFNNQQFPNRNIVFVKANDSSTRIVGFKLSFGRTPTKVKIFNRVIDVMRRQSIVMVPLKRNEAICNKTYAIEIIQPDNRPNVQVSAFGLNTHEKVTEAKDWMECNSLLSFNDSSIVTEDAKEALLLSICRRLTGSPLPNPSVITCNLYSSMNIGLICREAILKTEKDPYKLFLQGIEEAIDREDIPADVKKIMTRDIALLNEKDAAVLKEDAFEKEIASGAFSLLLAFKK